MIPSLVILFWVSLTITLPILLLSATDIPWTGSTSKWSISTVGYRLSIFCLKLRSTNWDAVGEILPITHVR